MATLIKCLLTLVIGSILFGNGAFAANNIPYFNNPLVRTQRVFIENTNLSAKDFLATYMSKVAEERKYAETYLLGVLDTTEGKLWCSYRVVKTISIAELLFEEFETLSETELNKRAAYVITDILSSKLPCKKK